MKGLTPEQKAQYDREGYTILKSVFSKAECEEFVEHMMALHSGEKTLEGFTPREPDDWGRTNNQHWYDPKALALLIDSRLRQPLEDCFEADVEGIQTMYFYKGSEGRRHQDQCPLPGCMSAWLPLVDVNEDNGTIYIQPGSHKGELVTYWETLDENGKMDYEYRHAKTERIFEENNRPEISIIANQGDAVLFHGGLIHRGGPIKQPGALRHVMANHYIPYQFTDWPHTSWPRISFNGKQRYTD